MEPNPHKKPARHILPFAEWMNTMYPQPTGMHKFLKTIGVMDVLYLLYRFGIIKVEEKITHTNPLIERAMHKTTTQRAPVAKPTEKVVKRVKKPKAAAPKKTKKSEPVKELTVEFTEKNLPKEEIRPEPEPTPDIEPEPLILNEEPAPETKPIPTEVVWIDDERTAEEDLLKTDLTIGKDGITMGFEKHDANDETEILLCVNDHRYRVIDMKTKMNLSSMLQIAKVDDGELYVFGSGAHGVVSGKGYVAAAEAERIIKTLAESSESSVTITVTYRATKTATHTIDIRFERVN